jgi:hypothetical protein
MADESEVEALLQIWREQHDQARQLEAQRATLTNIVIVVASAALGFVAQHGLEMTMLVVTVPLVGLGCYGVLACLKYHERLVLHHRAARRFSGGIEARLPSLLINETWAELHAEQRLRFPRSFRVRLYVVWTALHVGVAMSGATLSVLILVG